MDGSLSESHKRHKTEPPKGTRKSHKKAQQNHSRNEKTKKMTEAIDRKDVLLFVPFVALFLCLFVMQ
jgi:hypothetical protein